MEQKQQQRHALIERIHVLVEEALRLPYGTGSFARREEIDWELVRLFRQIAHLFDGPMPYWVEQELRRYRMLDPLANRSPQPPLQRQEVPSGERTV